MDSQKRLLITGGSGFIGQHCVSEALKRGHSVTVVDLKDGRLSAPNLTYIKCDARDSVAYRAELEEADAVVHLAATVSVRQCEESIESTYQNNVMTAVAIRTAMSNARKPQNFVFASSAAVYGDLGQSRAKETSETQPLSNYGLQKLFAEKFLLHNATEKVPTIALRFFNVFGPGMDRNSPYSGVIEIFLRRCELGQPLIIRGTGLQTRDFVFVGDVARAVIDAAASKNKTGVYNVASGSAITVTSLADQIEPLFGRPADRIFEKVAGFEIQHSQGDATKIKEHMGWEARTLLADALRATLENRK